MTLKVKGGPYHAARVVAHMVGPLLVLVVSPFGFFSWSSISQKNYMAKSLGTFSVWMVPESQKHSKTRKSASQC
jgi:hypothetical protein